VQAVGGGVEPAVEGNAEWLLWLLPNHLNALKHFVVWFTQASQPVVIRTISNQTTPFQFFVDVHRRKSYRG
jgi:hypothetical protein